MLSIVGRAAVRGLRFHGSGIMRCWVCRLRVLVQGADLQTGTDLVKCSGTPVQYVVVLFLQHATTRAVVLNMP